MRSETVNIAGIKWLFDLIVWRFVKVVARGCPKSSFLYFIRLKCSPIEVYIFFQLPKLKTNVVWGVEVEMKRLLRTR